ncbi:MAG: DUF4350 domain-containing protein [Protaetiibacter sp.]
MTAIEATGEAASAASGGDASSSRPRTRRRVALVLLWIAIVLVVVIGGLAVWAAGQTSRAGQHDRSPADPGEAGAMALAQVLAQQGVDVTVTHSFWETEAAVGDGRGVTLLVDDDWWVLTDEAYARVLNLSLHLVVVQPTDVALEQLTPGVEYGGFGGGELPADCSVPAVRRAASVSAGGDAYTAPASAERCFASGDGYGLVRLERGSRIVTLLGLGEVLENRYVADSGNAALALGLLGEQAKLVWYQPDVDDLAFEQEGSLASLQGTWFPPLVVLLLLVGIAAALWRGRRMGPVVVENLPVEVRSSETMEGRARLYERGGARDHALATLRDATLARLARILGLGRHATPEEIIGATAVATERPVAALTALLHTEAAHDDRGFVRISDELLRLEQELARAVRPR